MQAIEERFAIYREQHLGLVGKIIYREQAEILDQFPESESAAEVVRDLEKLAITSGLQRKLTELILKRLQAQAANNTSVLEVCGGNCWLLRRVISQTDKIGFYVDAVGSDISQLRIKMNKASLAHVNMGWSVADATDLWYEDQQFEFALNCQALHHFPVDAAIKLLRELKRVARKVIIFDLRRTLYGPIFVKMLSPFYSQNFINDGIASHRRAYSIEEMRFLLKVSDLPYRASPFTPVGMLLESI